MRFGPALRNIPTRVVTGAFIFHSGLEKWNAQKEHAEALHGMAKGAYPVVESVPPERFTRALSITEMTTGTLLLAPFVSNAVAGAALTGFSGALVGLYAKTPGIRREGSIWPEQTGIALSKDAWMFGIGLSLLLDPGAHSKHRRRRQNEQQSKHQKDHEKDHGTDQKDQGKHQKDHGKHQKDH